MFFLMDGETVWIGSLVKTCLTRKQLRNTSSLLSHLRTAVISLRRRSFSTTTADMEMIGVHFGQQWKAGKIAFGKFAEVSR